MILTPKDNYSKKPTKSQAKSQLTLNTIYFLISNANVNFKQVNLTTGHILKGFHMSSRFKEGKDKVRMLLQIKK